MAPGAGPEAAGEAAREWIAANVPGEWLDAARQGDIARLRSVRPVTVYTEWYPALARAGMVVPAWPVEHGGLGLEPETARAIDVELASARLARLNILGLGLAGPTILQWGTLEQQRRLLWPIVTNAEVWCQLFSEPGAGSDLAALGTRALREGDAWVVSGQKVWSSFAHTAQRGMLLARTDPDVPKHEGITWFALDMASPGIEVRPLRQLTGDAEFNEVFFDGVSVPDADRIGPPGAGWKVATTTLMNERATISGAGTGFAERLGGRSVERLVELARSLPERPADDPVVRQRLARLWSESRVIAWTNQRARATRSAGRPPGPEGSIGKLFHSEHNQRLQECAVNLLGARATARPEGDTDASGVVHGFLRSLAETIAGGTSEVQRNILGERVLGLPREPAEDRGVPWREIPRDTR